MRNSVTLLLVGVSLVFSGCAIVDNELIVADEDVTTKDIIVKELRCEYRTNPLGIDVVKPRLSWILQSGRRGKMQTAYHILVAASAEKLRRHKGNLWDTGKVNSDQSIHVVYKGKRLKSQMRCFWKVRVWDEKGNVSPWSETASWSMGMLKRSDWKAKWIGDDILRKQKIGKEERWGKRVNKYDRYYYPCTYMRKEFSLSKPVRHAVAYATVRGLYELYINGARLGKDYFTPGWTVHEKRIYYQAYDVTKLVQVGDNAMGAIIGDGWYILLHNEMYAGRQTKLLAQLYIEYTDGTNEVIVTDESWKLTMDGPIWASDIYNGEDYDARREMDGWAKAGFRDKLWEPVVVMEGTDAELTRHPGEPIQKTMEIRPLEMTEPRPGVYVFNMGHNFSGWARLKVKGKGGTKVTLRFAEMLNPDGTIYTTNLRSAKVTDHYILKGEAEELWEPRFTYHGFQYVEVTGYPGRCNLDSVTGIVLRSNAPITSSFECSNPMLNKLYSNIMWGQRSNYFETPTDCPQRDERLGWTGDAQVFIRTGAYNMDIASFFTSWMITLNDNQYPDGQYPVIAPVGDRGSSAGWSDAAIICPWVIYNVYGDRRILERHYKQMGRWIDYMEKNSSKLVRRVWGFGDWLNLDEVETPKPVINTAYFAYSTSLMAKIADVLEKKKDAKEYQELFEKIKKAFNDAFVSEDGKVKGNTQTAYLLALKFGLLDDEKQELAARHLIERIKEKDWHLSTGFLGVNLLLPTLEDIGRVDVAYRLLMNETYPSWLYSVRQGATTIWERWNSYTVEDGFGDPNMNSFNHYAYGSAGQWMFSAVGGIDTDGPGFKNIIIRPRPGGDITYAKASYKSIHGQIATHWKLVGDVFKLDVTIPANTTATIYVPAKDASSVTEGGKPAAKAEGVNFLRVEENAVVFAVDSGQYQFVSKLLR